MSTKTAIVILSDPKSNSDEALGRVLNALALTYDLKHSSSEVLITFQGAGTRWVTLLQDPSHPAHSFFEAVKDKVLGVSCGCADVFGAEDSKSAGFDVLTENLVPGTTGLAPLGRLIGEGYQVVTF